MKLNVPDEIADNFLDFLDVAQCSFYTEDEKKFTDMERKTLAWVRKQLGKRASVPWKNKKEEREAFGVFRDVMRG